MEPVTELVKAGEDMPAGTSAHREAVLAEFRAER